MTIAVGLLIRPLRMRILHRVYDQTNQQVQNSQCGHHDEGHKEHPCVSVKLHHRPCGPHLSAFQGHDLKQGVGRAVQSAEPFREVSAKQFSGHHRPNIKNNFHHQKHRGHTRQGRDKTRHRRGATDTTRKIREMRKTDSPEPPAPATHLR